jgi:choline dehydrogenase-like flavoprotein
MAAHPTKGVVDTAHRVFGMPNLYVVDGSVLPTQGSANPGLTIMALAARCADRLIRLGRYGLREQELVP